MSTKTTARPRQRKLLIEGPDKAENVENTPEATDGFIYVKRAAYGKEEEHTETVRVPDLGTVLKGMPPARVRIGGGITRNLGDYNSARVDVMIEMPCIPEVSEIRRVVDLISGQLDEIIPAELAKAQE